MREYLYQENACISSHSSTCSCPDGLIAMSQSTQTAPQTQSSNGSANTIKPTSSKSCCGNSHHSSPVGSASRSIPRDWETQLLKALSYLSGDLTYDNRAEARTIIKNLLGG